MAVIGGVEQDIVKLLHAILKTDLLQVCVDALTRRLRTFTILESSSGRIGYVGGIQKLPAGPYTDTTTNLASGASYTGTSRDTQVDSSSPFTYYGIFQVATISDLTGTLWIQESADGSTWRTLYSVNTTSLTDTDASTKYVTNVTWKVTQRYVRLVYKNTGAATTTLLNIFSRVIGM